MSDSEGSAFSDAESEHSLPQDSEVRFCFVGMLFFVRLFYHATLECIDQLVVSWN